jgi:N-acetylmuramoyl-L-alanine amidase
MKRLFLIAGHHDKDPGAIARHLILGEIREADLTKELRDLLLISLKKFNPDKVIFIDNDIWTLNQTINWVKNHILPGDLMIDIHFNAFPEPGANGAETLVKNGSSQPILNRASRFSKVISDTLGIRDRGAKTEAQSGRTRIGILHGIGDRFLLEIKFMSNQVDVDRYNMNKHLLVDALTREIENQMQ